MTTSLPRPPYIAIPLRPHIIEGLAALSARAQSGRLSDADKKTGASLLADAYADIIDHCLVDLLKEMDRTHPSALVHEALKVAGEVKEKSNHYLGWVVGFFSSERLIPVIAHFNGLTHELALDGAPRGYTAFAIPPALAADAARVLDELKTGRARDLKEGTELLIQVIEEAIHPLMIHPKQLMKFNFVVNKTLDGVISLVVGLVKRMLRKLSPQIDRELYPMVATHLSRFLITA
jgi:hypothetical protein